ncbi:MAG: hypothetical protein QM496_14180 [Verrucomicrobiota bacterium]
MNVFIGNGSICTADQILATPLNNSNDEGIGHVWLKIDNNWHVDITSDQFSASLQKIIVSTGNDFFSTFHFIEGYSDWQPFSEFEEFVNDLLHGTGKSEEWEIVCDSLEILQ